MTRPTKLLSLTLTDLASLFRLMLSDGYRTSVWMLSRIRFRVNVDAR